MWTCKHCKAGFSFGTTSEKANHSRWCSKNPKSKDTTGLKIASRKVYDRKLGKLIDYSMNCQECENSFVVVEREKKHPEREKYFCGRSCANATGGKAKSANLIASGDAHYRVICFKHHSKSCVVCQEKNIVAVHHYDGDHSNNDPRNLVPMCPTHHQYWHSKYKSVVENIVHRYVDEFSNSFTPPVVA